MIWEKPFIRNIYERTSGRKEELNILYFSAFILSEHVE